MEQKNYVERVLSRFQNVKWAGDGWEVSCPCVSHGTDGVDQKPSLRITVGTGGRVLLRCRVGCSFWDIMNSVGLTLGDLVADAFHGEEPLASMIDERCLTTADEDEYDLWNKVYNDVLDNLTLEKEHAQSLKNRGLSELEIEINRYRSYRSFPCGALFDTYGNALLSVPGFLPSSTSGACLSPGLVSGLLIPVRNWDGKIIALKIRSFNPGHPRYSYFSSMPSGRGPGTPLHCPLGDLSTSLGTIRITEGELKADVATALSPIFTVGVGGVTLWHRVTPFLTAYKSSIHKVVVSFDWGDVKHRKPVTEQTLMLIQSCKAQGFHVGLETWDLRFKGIDDALASKGDALIKVLWDGSDCDIISYVHDLIPKGSAKNVSGWTPSPFPVDVLPDPLQKTVENISISLPCPVDFVGVPLLVVAGSMFGSSRRLQVQPGWEVRSNLYVATVASPGSKKTPAMKKVIAPCYEVQKSLENQFQSLLAAWEEAAIKKKAQIAAYKNELKKFYSLFPDQDENHPAFPTDPGYLEPSPVAQDVFVTDITSEKNLQILHDSKKGVIHLVDELVSLIKSFNAYRGGKGADRQLVLSLWSGETVKVDRKSSSSSLIVEDPFYSIFGGIQPDKLSELEDFGGREDGFVHRILFSMPACEQLPSMTWQGIDHDSTQAWSQVVHALHGLSHDPETHSPVVLTLKPEARQRYSQWYETHRKEQENPDFSSEWLGPWSKMIEYCLRLSLILHMLREACSICSLTSDETLSSSEVDVQDIEGGIRLIEYFKNHCVGVYRSMEFDRDDRKIKDFVRWVGSQGGMVLLRQIWGKSSRWSLKSNSSALSFISKVCDRGYGYVVGEGKARTFVLELPTDD